MDTVIMNYENEGGDNILTTIQDEDGWLSVKDIAKLYGVETSIIYRHIRNIKDSPDFDPEELLYLKYKNPNGGRPTEKYNLEWIVDIGFHVQSKEGRKFRKAVRGFIKQLAKDGYVVNKRQVLNDPNKLEGLGTEFRRLRATSTNFQNEITGFLKEGASDYYSNEKERNSFFRTVSDKLNYAVTKMKAKNIRYHRTHHSLPECGATTVTGKKGTQVQKADLNNARNFFTPDEHKIFAQLVDSVLTLMRSITRKEKKPMSELLDKIDTMLEVLEYENIPIYYRGVDKKTLKSHIDEQWIKFDNNRKLKAS